MNLGNEQQITFSWNKRVLIAIAILIFSFLLTLIKINSHLINPFEVSEVKYDFYDLYFAKFGLDSIPPRNDIFIVNTAGLSRNQVADLLDSIINLSPKVIAIDIIYENTKDSSGTAYLEKTLFKIKDKIVLASALDSLSTFHDKFTNGFVYFPSDDGYTIRNHYDSDKNKNSFVCEIYNKYKGEKPESKKGKSNYIHYRYPKLSLLENCNYNRIPNSIIELTNGCFGNKSIQSMVSDKIVLLGHINKDTGSIIDKYFTPLNKEYLGRSLPDMEGIMIHANSLAMHLDKAYISTMYPFIQWGLACLLLFFNVSILLRFTKSKFVFKDNVLRFIQTIQVIGIFIFAIVIFHYFRIRIDLSIFLLPILSFVDIGEFVIEKVIPFFNEKKI